ncbi:hypothetical protein JF116_09935 [Campylobacter fetus subsp. venerealis]|uniref:hypothetical protein n=1 Tax=Campylobacter fetus TaxID=196 RepID=UPI00190C66CC|nr:hypothetical protein [Campylobacter fetus]MBK3487697.1 hypothetical protein [Campylobacter fetus subsp. venerealis]
MKLNELQMYPAPVSDAIFLGKLKSNKWVEKIDFTEQFYQCLAELCKKELNKNNDDSITLIEQFESGLTIEIKARSKNH